MSGRRRRPARAAAPLHAPRGACRRRPVRSTRAECRLGRAGDCVGRRAPRAPTVLSAARAAVRFKVDAKLPQGPSPTWSAPPQRAAARARRLRTAQRPPHVGRGAVGRQPSSGTARQRCVLRPRRVVPARAFLRAQAPFHTRWRGVTLGHPSSRVAPAGLAAACTGPRHSPRPTSPVAPRGGAVDGLRGHRARPAAGEPRSNHCMSRARGRGGLCCRAARRPASAQLRSQNTAPHSVTPAQALRPHGAASTGRTTDKQLEMGGFITLHHPGWPSWGGRGLELAKLGPHDRPVSVPCCRIRATALRLAAPCRVAAGRDS